MVIHKKRMALLAVCILFTACKTAEIIEEKYPEDNRETAPLAAFFDNSAIFGQSITGFALYDPETGRMLYERGADRFYTPASNTKILTLYASLKSLPDTLPSLRYEVKDDTLYFRGTGDPAFLNPNFDHHGAYEFLKNREETLVYYDAHFDEEHFGSGWSWDWYPAAYATEKTPFPVYGNMMQIQAQRVVLEMLDEEEPVKPAFFGRFLDHLEWNEGQPELVKRGLRDNSLLYAPKSDTVTQVRNVPFVYDSQMMVEMLSDTLGREVGYTTRTDLRFSETLYSTPADTLYRRFMIVSDNFIAEQLMLMISDREFDSMNTMRAIRHSLDTWMNDFPQTPSWNDGSGLTRYNLVTPHTLVILLDRLMKEYGEERTLSWFPAGGVRGTIRNLYHAPEGRLPFVYAKTGTLRNNTALSGYIYTDSGRRLIFSFINNNYVMGNDVIRNEMSRALNLIRETY